ncbi:MAG: hypothetical protein KDF60_17385 [Calditrichaeota bacterium]|nr:hypothetical protein [Calditrichota bacterium]
MFRNMFVLFFGMFLLFSCNKDIQSPATLEEFQARVDELNGMNKDLDSQRSDLYKLIREFNKSRTDNEQFDITSMDTLMGAPERDLLKAMFAEEKDISYNGLLHNIVEKNNEIGQLQNNIGDLKKEIAEIESQLPKPYVVAKGNTHYEIVVDYLVKQHQLSVKDAHNVAWKTALIDDLLPGNKIWLSYKDGIVGSYVTQGDAYMSPMKVMRMANKRRIEKAKTLSLGESAKSTEQITQN